MTVELFLGDCLEILPTLADKSVDAIITDLPYGTTACKWDVIIPLDEMWRQVKRICKGAFVTTASQPFTSVLVCSNLEWFKYEWIWEKTMAAGFLDANRKPLKAHENICVFSGNGHEYNPQMQAGAPYIKKQSPNRSSHYGAINPMVKVNNGERYPTTIVKISNGNNSSVHPTQKPVALYEYLIRTYTNEGDTVLDFTMGSGTTGVACVKTNRDFIGVEKEQNYFEIAERRIKEAQMQMVMPL